MDNIKLQDVYTVVIPIVSFCITTYLIPSKDYMLVVIIKGKPSKFQGTSMPKGIIAK